MLVESSRSWWYEINGPAFPGKEIFSRFINWYGRACFVIKQSNKSLKVCRVLVNSLQCWYIPRPQLHLHIFAKSLMKIFLPFTRKGGYVVTPSKGMKIGRARHFRPREPALVCTGTYLKLSPTPKPIHSSLSWIGRYNAIANTTISVSTVLIMILSQPCWTTWIRSLVSVCPSQGCKGPILILWTYSNLLDLWTADSSTSIC